MRLNRRTVTYATLTGVALIAALVPATPARAYAGTFLSYPHQTARTSVTGTNVVVTQKSWVGFTAGACLTVHDAVNVTIRDVDFDACGGGIFLLNVTGNIIIENVRGRNIGNGNIGSGQGNLIQFNNAWQSYPKDPTGAAQIRHIKEYGGDTEDVISVYKSGGIDALHPLVIGDVHIESPLPPDPLAWSSSSGTCANLGDAGGHDAVLQNVTALNCGQVGLQINKCTRCEIKNSVIYGAQRTGSNVGLSRYGTCSPACSGNKMTNNRVWWKNAAGSMNNASGTSNPDTLWSGNVLGDTTINPANLHVVL